jgi:hypothetical protein
MENTNELMSWKIPEYRKYQRQQKWYAVAVVIMLGLLIYSILTGNFLFAVILIVAGITMAVHDRNDAPEIDFAIQENGIKIGESVYGYDKFDNFWIYYEPSESKMLFFEFKNKVRPRLSIPLENKNPIKVRAILLKFLTENLQRENEPLSEQLSRILKI